MKIHIIFFPQESASPHSSTQLDIVSYNKTITMAYVSIYKPTLGNTQAGERESPWPSV